MAEYTIRYHEFNSYKELSDSIQNLVLQARKVAQKAYAPYSKFKVGAAVEMEDGTIVLGSNQENIAYPSGLCAERTALFYAGSIHPEKIIKRIVVVAEGDLIDVSAFVSPCGSCRQVMVESAKRQNQPFEVFLASQNDRIVHFENIYDLLPFNFGEK